MNPTQNKYETTLLSISQFKERLSTNVYRGNIHKAREPFGFLHYGPTEKPFFGEFGSTTFKFICYPPMTAYYKIEGIFKSKDDKGTTVKYKIEPIINTNISIIIVVGLFAVFNILIAVTGMATKEVYLFLMCFLIVVIPFGIIHSRYRKRKFENLFLEIFQINRS